MGQGVGGRQRLDGCWAHMPGDQEEPLSCLCSPSVLRAHLVSMQQLPTCSLSVRTIKCSQVSMGSDGKFEDEQSPKEHPLKKPQ